MSIKYKKDEEIKRRVNQIIDILNWKHIKKENIICFKSEGTNSKRVIARCWALPKIFQQALNTEAHYCIEVLSERFDKLSESEKDKVLIHELMHIPKTFGGGLKHHGHVNAQNVNKEFQKYKLKKSKKDLLNLLKI